MLSLQRADVGRAKESMHLSAKIAQPHTGIARRPSPAEIRNGLFQRRIFIVQFLEGEEAADQRAGLAGFDAGRQQE